MWLPIKEEVRVWFNEGLEGWLREGGREDWFNSEVRAMIPDYMVDDPDVLKKLREKVGKWDLEEEGGGVEEGETSEEEF